MGSRSKKQKRERERSEARATQVPVSYREPTSSAARNFNKPALAFEAQAELLISRGLTCAPKPEDEDGKARLVRHLKNVNYYHLSAYWYPFRKQDPDREGKMKRLDDFKPGSTFDQVWDCYVFDRRFRLLLMDAIERIEISIRTNIVHHLVSQKGAFALYDYFPGVLKQRSTEFNDERTVKLQDNYKKIVRKLGDSFKQSKEDFALHYRNTYVECQSDAPKVPFWVACELMSLGDWSWLFDCMTLADRRAVACTYGLREDVLSSWLRCLKNVRNFCAHHGRLWNRVLTENPKLQESYSISRWPTFLNGANVKENLDGRLQKNRIYAILCICNYLLQLISPGTEWRGRVLSLVKQYQNRIFVTEMGFPLDWQNHPTMATYTSQPAAV